MYPKLLVPLDVSLLRATQLITTYQKRSSFIRPFCVQFMMALNPLVTDLVEKKIEYASALRSIVVGEELPSSVEARIQQNCASNNDSQQQLSSKQRDAILRQRIASTESRIHQLQLEIQETQMIQRRLEEVNRRKFPYYDKISLHSLSLLIEEIHRLTEEQKESFDPSSSTTIQF